MFLVALTLVFLDKGYQICDRLFHNSGALNDLRQKHFPGTEQFANNIHAIHQGAFDHFQRR